MCKYCDGRTTNDIETGIDYPVKDNLPIRIHAAYYDRTIMIFYYGEPLAYFDINYCPMCGRKINKEETENA